MWIGLRILGLQIDGIFFIPSISKKIKKTFQQFYFFFIKYKILFGIYKEKKQSIILFLSKSLYFLTKLFIHNKIRIKI